MFRDFFTRSKFSSLLILLSILNSSYSQPPSNVLVPYVWREVNFVFRNEIHRSNAIANGSFVPANVLINDLDVWPGVMTGGNSAQQRVFVTTPRVTTGIPATLSTVTNIRDGDSFLLSPFPNWESQQVDSECNGIISVDKIHIDRCGLLWVIDTGRINEFTAPTRVCGPKVLLYDLQNSDTLVERYEFPTGVFLDRSSLTTTVTDSRSDNCRDAIAYIADLNGSGLIVFDLYQRTSWRIDHNYFYAYPRFGTFTIAGQSFDLMDGIFGMALGPITQTGDRILYFHSLASIRESWVSTSVLRNATLRNDRDAFRQLFSLSPEFREGQSSLEVMTENGILIYSVLPRNALACWNTATEPTRENTQIIYESYDHLQFVSGMKLKGDTLWIATNRVQTVMSTTNITTNTTGINNDYRMRIILINSVKELLQGTRCLSPTSTNRGGPQGPPLRPPLGRPPLGRPPLGPPPSSFNYKPKFLK